MRRIRNCDYTIYKGSEIEFTQNPNGEFMLIYRGEKPLDNSFMEVTGLNLVFNRIIKRDELNNAFAIETYAQHKGFRFQVDRYENGKYRLTTSDEEVYKKLNLHMVDRGWYDIEVPCEEIERMWEERKPSGFGFPFPEGLKEIEELEF